MKTLILTPLALLIVAGCSEPTPGTTVSSTPGNAAEAAAIAANTRPDGSVIDESKPHARTEANAQDKPMDHMVMMASMMSKPSDSAATKGYKQSLMRMMEGMPPFTGDADIDFNKQMRVHHLAAIDMAEVQLARGRNPESKALAQKIIEEQRKEIAQIDGWLKQRGQ